MLLTSEKKRTLSYQDVYENGTRIGFALFATDWTTGKPDLSTMKQVGRTRPFEKNTLTL